MGDKTSYVVLKQITAEEAADLQGKGRELWVTVDQSVDAFDNTDAIKEATKDMSTEEKRGTYAAPATRNFPVIPRNIRTEEVDEFGAASTTGTRARKPAVTQDE